MKIERTIKETIFWILDLLITLQKNFYAKSASMSETWQSKFHSETCFCKSIDLCYNWFYKGKLQTNLLGYFNKKSCPTPLNTKITAKG